MEGGVSEAQVDYTTIGVLRKKLIQFPNLDRLLIRLDERAGPPPQLAWYRKDARLRSDQAMKSTVLLFALIAAVVCSVLLTSGPAVAAAAGSGATGMVWEKHGDWHLNGSPNALRLGEAIPPGGLVTADVEGPAHSIVILLPDGQRMLCECYEAKTCSQGFRVPAITPQPPPAVWDMFVGVRNILLLRPATAETAFPIAAGRAAMAGNFELVAPISPQGEVSITSALRVLPAGQYSLSAGRDGQQATEATRPVIQ